MIFSSIRSRSSTLALAFALATGTALTAVAIEAPAQAQRKKDKDKASKEEYSDEFRAQFNEMAELAQGDDTQKAQAAARADTFAAALSTPDDRYQGGILLFNLGIATDDPQLQLTGITNMVESGRAPADRIANFTFTAYQTANSVGDYDAARKFLASMADNGYTFDGQLTDGTTRTFTADDFRLMAIETYWANDDYDGGFKALDEMIAAKRAAGEKVPENWIRRGFATAIESENRPLVGRFARDYVTEYPSEASWRDAVAVLYNQSQLDPQGVLDLLRLARRVNGLQNRTMYGEYIDNADPRRLPGEVASLINDGFAAGTLDRSDSYVSEALAEANRRVATDERELPNFLAEARQSNADLTTLVAAGDTFLSYGRGAEAEEFYTRALPMAGVDTARVLTRLGIAQLDQGKAAEAEATFNKVEGARQAMANLWAVYASQQGGM